MNSDYEFLRLLIVVFLAFYFLIIQLAETILIRTISTAKV